MQACISANSECQNETKLPSDQTTYNFRDLSPHTYYTFSVKAFTGAGDSDSLNITRKTSEHSEFLLVCMSIEATVFWRACCRLLDVRLDNWFINLFNQTILNLLLILVDICCILTQFMPLASFHTP